MPDSAEKNPFASPGVRFGIRFLGVFVLIMAPFAIYHATAGYLEDRDSPNWPRVPGEVYDQRVYEQTRRGVTTYSVYIKYRYSVNGKNYTGERVAPDFDYLSAEVKDRTLAKYPVGSKPDVAYAPSDPDRSYLEPGASPGAIMKPILALLFPVIGVGMLLATRRPKPPVSR